MRIVLTDAVEGDDGQPRKTVKGDLAGIEDGIVTRRGQEGRADVRFPLEQIHSAKLVLTDRLIAATRPLDTSGVEEVDELGEDILEEEED